MELTKASERDLEITEGHIDYTIAYPALMIVPGAGNASIKHQYNCVHCDQWEMTNCKVVPLTGSGAKELEALMDCGVNRRSGVLLTTIQGYFPKVVNIDIRGEALVKAYNEDGSYFYLVSANCD